MSVAEQPCWPQPWPRGPYLGLWVGAGLWQLSQGPRREARPAARVVRSRLWRPPPRWHRPEDGGDTQELDTCRLGLRLPAGVFLPSGGFHAPVLRWELFQGLSVQGGGEMRRRHTSSETLGSLCASGRGQPGAAPPWLRKTLPPLARCAEGMTSTLSRFDYSSTRGDGLGPGVSAPFESTGWGFPELSICLQRR